MARPRIFVSSTYYDLKHIRSSLENFIQTLGFDPILSEKGQIAYTPDIPLDESCYREAATADIFVLVIGGRYGSEASSGEHIVPKTFYDRYDSVTKLEYRSAAERDIPMYVLVERPVHAEYETFLRNKHNESVTYAHVDSINVFRLIEDIFALPRNNPVQQFDRYAEIETWLREQWSGLFRELLQRRQTQTQLTSLQGQVESLQEINKTLRTYLEEVVSRIAPKEAADTLIRAESKRLHEAAVHSAIRSTSFGRALVEGYGFDTELVRVAARESDALADFLNKLAPHSTLPEFSDARDSWLSEYPDIVQDDLDDIKQAIAAAEKSVSPPKQRARRKRPTA